MSTDQIVVRGLRLWAHVGVLEQERQRGQWFELDVVLAADLRQAGRDDALAASLDYSRLIADLQRLAPRTECLTLEHFSERILSRVEALYGAVPVRLELRKCAAPVPGFTGVVAVRRSRHWPPGPGFPSPGEAPHG
ncbi:dihydroneopterin aldolase [Cyanobium sp. NIES-981]|uniref:dihydroneopterin aldolase n=1 Tax=Cyanobium sp. NIES-981 TaxID=1851505 RepID=UPI0007DCF5F2|nr:dihydroneopterin aldolase [Cyanobium sp. NIES-981]SBO42467.1 Dihydroneopterin aldolase [Cyanobium sp. NIES-981]